MKNNLLKIIFFLYILILILQPFVYGNPLPMPYAHKEIGTPAFGYVYHDGIQFISENVEYTIDSFNDVKVNASYEFFNTINHTNVVNIFLPLFDIRPNYDEEISVKISINDSISEHNFSKGSGISSYSLDEANSAFTNERFYGVYEFLEFEPFEKYFLNVSYWLDDAVKISNFIYFKSFNCEYLTTTGLCWNNSIDKATFNFKIKKSLYSSGLTEFNIREENGYIIASKIFSNWVPNHNIKAEWISGNPFIFPVVVLISVIVSCIIIYLKLKYFKKEQNKKRKNHHLRAKQLKKEQNEINKSNGIDKFNSKLTKIALIATFISFFFIYAIISLIASRRSVDYLIGIIGWFLITAAIIAIVTIIIMIIRYLIKWSKNEIEYSLIDSIRMSFKKQLLIVMIIASIVTILCFYFLFHLFRIQTMFTNIVWIIIVVSFIFSSKYRSIKNNPY